jgi:SpoVK/Ycf46/Vps4 family AAA+-type ATPase
MIHYPAAHVPPLNPAGRMTLSEDVNLEEFVMAKDELSGADIKAVCTEAGLLALRERRMRVTQVRCCVHRHHVTHPSNCINAIGPAPHGCLALQLVVCMARSCQVPLQCACMLRLFLVLGSLLLQNIVCVNASLVHAASCAAFCCLCTLIPPFSMQNCTARGESVAAAVD